MLMNSSARTRTVGLGPSSGEATVSDEMPSRVVMAPAMVAEALDC